MNRRLALVLLWALAAADLALAAAAWTRQPWANGPAEWRWQYATEGAGGLPGAAPAGRGGALLVLAAALAGLGAVAARRNAPAAAGGALAAAIGCGAALTFALAAWQPGGLPRVTAALVSRNSFGYLWDASLAPPTASLLADYPVASEGLNQHSVTHPPGPLLAVRALAWLDRLLPPPAPGPDGGLPGLAAAAVEREVARAHSHSRPVPAVPPGAWCVAAFAVLLPLLSALAAWPLHRLALLLGASRPAALAAALLWLLVPARSLFTPSFDQALPLPFLAAACLAASSGRTAARDRTTALAAAAAGLLLFACCFLSYGCMPALPLVALMPLLAAAPAAAVAVAAGAPRTAPPPGGEPGGAVALARLLAPARRIGPPIWPCMALGFLLPYLVLWAVFHHDAWHAMRVALDLHRRIAVDPRSYSTWLLWNPYDFALLASPAVLGLAAGAAWTSGRPAADRRRQPAWAPLAWCFWGLLGFLWVSGGVRGEVGRIWLLWMPFACLLAARGTEEERQQELGLGLEEQGQEGQEGQAPERADPARRLAFAALLASQALLLLALAARMVFVG